MLKKTAPTTPTATKSDENGVSYNFDFMLLRKYCNLSLNTKLIPNNNKEGSTITRLYPISTNIEEGGLIVT